jgi:hypothetical protein
MLMASSCSSGGCSRTKTTGGWQGTLRRGGRLQCAQITNLSQVCPYVMRRWKQNDIYASHLEEYMESLKCSIDVGRQFLHATPTSYVALTGENDIQGGMTMIRLNRLLFKFCIVHIPPGFHCRQYFTICLSYLHPQLLFAMAIAVYMRPSASLTYLTILCSQSFFVCCILILHCAKCLIFALLFNDAVMAKREISDGRVYLQ